MSHDSHDAQHSKDRFRKIYFTLVVLLVISVAGPFVGVVWITLITAFGIALVKASLVIENFMALKWERRIVRWVLATSLVLMGLFVAGVAPDVMEHEGQRWVNQAAIAAVERGIEGGHEEGAEAEHEEEADGAAEAGGAFSAQEEFNVACAVCHGTGGDGTGMAGQALDPRPANFTDPAFWATRDDERIFNAIKNGAASVGGSPLMVAWSSRFSDEEIRELVEYVKSFGPQ